MRVEGRCRALALAIGCLVMLVAAPRVARAALIPINVSGSQPIATIKPGDARLPLYVLSLYNPNTLVGADTITRLTFENKTSGPGNQSQRDAESGVLTITASRRAADALAPPPGATLVTATFFAGDLTFNGLNFTIGPGESLYVVVAGAPTLNARDSDALDMKIHDTNAFTMANDGDLKIVGTLDPGGNFPINGMVAAQIAVDTVATTYLPIGGTRQLALALRIPANGYSADKLQSLEVDNRGTALGNSDLARMDVWLDDGDGVWEANQEEWLGSPGYIGNRRWVLAGLSTDLITPAGGKVFVTVDVAAGAGDNQTVRLVVPDQGITVQSNNDGPLDREVGNPVTSVISLVDRVVLSPVTLVSGIARPGVGGLPLLGFTATNTYASARTLSGLTLANLTFGPGTLNDRDAELERVELRLDGNGDRQLGDASADPVIATAVFANGHAFFTGFSVPLMAGQTRALFVTGDVSLLRARDGDDLAAGIAAREDLAFTEPTAVAGGFPLASGNAWTVDGMIAAQVANGGAPPRTLAPGDGPVVALDLTLHRNGYEDDTLESITIANLGTATPADLAAVRLWRDGGDGVFNGGAGDDQDLGPLGALSGGWSSGALTLPLGASGARMFVSVTADSAASDSATVRLALPVSGIAVQSGNDGPLDQTVINPDALLIANRGLLTSLGYDMGAVTVGQTVTLTMAVRSTSAESLLAVAPSLLTGSGSAVLTPLTGPNPAARDLAPGQSGSFQWTFRCDGAGVTRVSAHASGTGSPSGQLLVSLDAQSGELRVLARADSLPLRAFDAMPQSVSRGQVGVLPLYLTFVAPDSNGSPVRVTGFRVRIEREDGSDVVPAALLARAVVVAASETLLVRDAVETSGALLDLTLSKPAIVEGTAPVTLALGLDVGSGTVVPDFRLRIGGPIDVRAEDAATLMPVEVRLQDTPWPVLTGLARVLAAPTALDLFADSLASVRASRGQTEVTLARLTLMNPGVTGVTSDVRVGALDVKLADTLGSRIARPGQILKRLRLRSGVQTLADRSVAAGSDSVIALTLSPLLSAPVNAPTPVLLVADLSDTASIGAFRLELGDSARFDARDPSSGDRVPVRYQTHPVAGPVVRVEARAETLFVLGIPQLPETLGVGARSVSALSLVLRHPGPPGTGRLRIDGLTVRCIDASGAALVPATFLDRLQVLWNSGLAASVTDPPASGSTVHATLAGAMLEPGDSARVTLVLDFETTAPASSFALSLTATGLESVDANLGTPAVPVVEAGGDYPLLSGITRIVTPSRTLLVDLIDAMPAALAPDGRDVMAGTVSFVNGASAGSAPVRIDRLTLRARGAAGPIALGAAVAHAWVSVNGGPPVSGAALTTDSTMTTLLLPTELLVSPGVVVPVAIGFSTRTAPAVKTFALEIAAAGIGVVQPNNPLFDVAVLPAPGRTFPLATRSGTYADASLAGSWSNFPNPFTPSREVTTFAYYLPSPARVSLAIWTPRGEPVASLLERADRPGGFQQGDTWDGRNGVGERVMNGVYIAELTVEVNGRTERLRRKVAVVR